MTDHVHNAAERPEVTRVREAGRTTVLVIGGGINGISTFRDLALQGVDVVLVESGDFASGASSASSHMIHGGIRYLENGEFRLVKESVTERNGLLKIAPHYVKPLETTIPIYSTFSGILSAPLRFLTHKSGKPQERGAFLIKVGLTIYDTFSRDGGMSDTYDDYYRNDWNQNYASLGGSYDDYAPAYRYGNAMRRDPRYQGRDWDDVESDLRSDWDTRYGGSGMSTWERMKAAVRSGWNRMTS